MKILSWNHLLTNSEFSFVLTQFLTFLPPEYSGLFPKHLIHSLIILLHRNLWMGCYVSIEQVLGPPFDKMSHCHSAASLPNSKSNNINQRNAFGCVGRSLNSTGKYHAK